MDIPSIAASINTGSVKNYDNVQTAKNSDTNNNGQTGMNANSVLTPVDKNTAAALPVNGTESAASTNKVDDGECQTCKHRRYQDQSNDSGVSYQTPTKLGSNVAMAVSAHEHEHVARNQLKATREGREVVSQSVILHTDVCPECGRSYVSGGTTRTVTRANIEPAQHYNAIPGTGKGTAMDITA